MAGSSPILIVEDLAIGRPEGSGFKNQVEGLSLTLVPGEKFALVGESGSGKTLTACALTGLLPSPWTVTAGRILFDGREVPPWDDTHWARLRGRSLLLLFQSPLTALNPVLKIGRQISEALTEPFGWDRTTADNLAASLLDRVGIPPIMARRYPGQLSGGMRQRVLLALALGLRPRLLIADEPFTGLDPLRRGEILNLLEKLHRDSQSALFLISHDLRLVSRWADKVAILAGGRVVESAPTAELLASPRHPYTRELVQSLRTLEQSLA